MKLPLTQIRRKIPDFNVAAYGEQEFWLIIEREQIHFDSWPLPNGGKGFYGVNRKYPKTYRYIVIDSGLFESGNWFPTACHELGHHFLHVPAGNLSVYFSGREHTRQDREADVFSLVMRIPLPLLLELMHTPLDEICGFTKDELIERKRIYEIYGY